MEEEIEYEEIDVGVTRREERIEGFVYDKREEVIVEDVDEDDEDEDNDEIECECECGDEY